MACGLIHSPEILFLDEATSGADLASRRTFWRRINALAAAGTSFRMRGRCWRWERREK